MWTIQQKYSGILHAVFIAVLLSFDTYNMLDVAVIVQHDNIC